MENSRIDNIQIHRIKRKLLIISCILLFSSTPKSYASIFVPLITFGAGVYVGYHYSDKVDSLVQAFKGFLEDD